MQRSRSTGSDLVPKRRPKSEFIPAAFLVEECGLHNKSPKPSSVKVSHGRWQAPKPQFKEFSNVNSPVQVDDESIPSSDDSFSSGSYFSNGEITSTVVRTLYECEAEDENELSFLPGQLIRNITKSDEPGWLRGDLNGKTGLLPRNYVKFM